MKEKDFFEKYNLTVDKVDSADIELGKASPVYGMITSFIEEDPTKGIVIVVNYSIKLVCSITEESKVQILKERAFESGVFVVTFEKKNVEAIIPEPNEINADTIFPFEGSCSTIMFGRRQEFNA